MNNRMIRRLHALGSRPERNSIPQPNSQIAQTGPGVVGQFECGLFFFECQMIFARGWILRISCGVVAFPSSLRSLMLFLATMRAATASIARTPIGHGIAAKILSICSHDSELST